MSADIDIDKINRYPLANYLIIGSDLNIRDHYIMSNLYVNLHKQVSEVILAVKNVSFYRKFFKSVYQFTLDDNGIQWLIEYGEQTKDIHKLLIIDQDSSEYYWNQSIHKLFMNKELKYHIIMTIPYAQSIPHKMNENISIVVVFRETFNIFRIRLWQQYFSHISTVAEFIKLFTNITDGGNRCLIARRINYNIFNRVEYDTTELDNYHLIFPIPYDQFTTYIIEILIKNLDKMIDTISLEVKKKSKIDYKNNSK